MSSETPHHRSTALMETQTEMQTQTQTQVETQTMMQAQTQTQVDANFSPAFKTIYSPTAESREFDLNELSSEDGEIRPAKKPKHECVDRTKELRTFKKVLDGVINCDINPEYFPDFKYTSQFENLEYAGYGCIINFEHIVFWDKTLFSGKCKLYVFVMKEIVDNIYSLITFVKYKNGSDDVIPVRFGLIRWVCDFKIRNKENAFCIVPLKSRECEFSTKCSQILCVFDNCQARKDLNAKDFNDMALNKICALKPTSLLMYKNFINPEPVVETLLCNSYSDHSFINNSLITAHDILSDKKVSLRHYDRNDYQEEKNISLDEVVNNNTLNKQHRELKSNDIALSRQRLEISENEKFRETLDNDIQKFRKKRRLMIDDITSLQNTQKEIQETIKVSKTKIKDLEKDIDDKSKEFLSWRKKHDSIQEKYNNLKETYNQFRAKHSSLKDKTENLEKTYLYLRTQMDELEIDIKMLYQKREDTQKEIHFLERQRLDYCGGSYYRPPMQMPVPVQIPMPMQMPVPVQIPMPMPTTTLPIHSPAHQVARFQNRSLVRKPEQQISSNQSTNKGVIKEESRSSRDPRISRDKDEQK